MAGSIDSRRLLRKLEKLDRYMERDAPRVMGTEGVQYFKQSFEKQAWEGRKWKESKRRKKSSRWYGFQYGARTVPPNNHPKRRGAKSGYKRRKPNAITNYSPAAGKRKTLSGLTGDLKESIDYRTTRRGAEVYSDVPYAAVHNEGGYARRFGGKLFRMPRRQFMGDSPRLRQKIHREMARDIKRILK